MLNRAGHAVSVDGQVMGDGHRAAIGEGRPGCDAEIDQLGPAALALGATSSTFDRWGGVLAQEIDAAAMTIYLKYEHYEADLSGPGLSATATDLDDADFVSVGGLINF